MYYNIKGEKIYYSSSVSSGNDILNLSMLGETVPNPNFKALHRIDKGPQGTMYTFEYITQGKMTIIQGNQELTASAGDLLILNNTASHYYFSDPKAPVGKLFIVCNGVYVDKLMEAFRITEGTVIRQLNLLDNFLHLITLAQCDLSRLPYATAELILRILHTLNPMTHAESQFVQAAPYPLYQQISNYIESHVQEHLQLEQIAANFSITPITLNRIFRKHYNTTPKKFILTAKVEVAKQLLSATDLPINRISEFLSFGHQNNFSNAFTKITGLSPSQYRKENPYIVHPLSEVAEPSH